MGKNNGKRPIDLVGGLLIFRKGEFFGAYLPVGNSPISDRGFRLHFLGALSADLKDEELGRYTLYKLRRKVTYSLRM